MRILEAERSQIVEPHDVVRVGMGVQDCVDEAQIFAECLLAKIGSGINQHRSFVVALAKLDENRGTHAGIPGIGRGADGAAATERGDAHGSAAAEENDLCLHLNFLAARGSALIICARKAAVAEGWPHCAQSRW